MSRSYALILLNPSVYLQQALLKSHLHRKTMVGYMMLIQKHCLPCSIKPYFREWGAVAGACDPNNCNLGNSLLFKYLSE